MVLIVIDGNIGSGKSTLLNKLSSKYPIHKEKIDDWPLKEFYEDPQRWGLALQIRILQTMTKPPVSDTFTFHERCPQTSKEVFWSVLWKTAIEDDIYQDVYTKYHWEPDIYIYLRSSPETCFTNISKRVQAGDSDITWQYITELHHLYEEYVSTLPNAIVIDADQDAETVYQSVINYISNL